MVAFFFLRLLYNWEHQLTGLENGSCQGQSDWRPIVFINPRVNTVKFSAINEPTRYVSLFGFMFPSGAEVTSLKTSLLSIRLKARLCVLSIPRNSVLIHCFKVVNYLFIDDDVSVLIHCFKVVNYLFIDEDQLVLSAQVELFVGLQ